MFRARSNEQGGITAYAVSLVIVAILLVGGVFLLKNTKTADVDVANVTTGDSSEQASDSDDSTSDAGNQTSDDSTLSDASDNSSSSTTDTTSDDTANTNTSTNADNSSIAGTGDASYAPETLTATGPEDFVAAVVGLVLAGGAVYAAWNYHQSRVAIRKALLRE